MAFESLFPPLVAGFLTILVTMFVVELTDKDALLLLALATRINPWIVFASGALAFTITTTIIVSVGYVLLQFVPVWVIRAAGGIIMIGFAIWSYLNEQHEEREVEKEGERVVRKATLKKTSWSIFLGALSMLIVLDLAGDATEVLTIVYVAHFQNVLLVFAGCVVALVAASAVETALGNRLGKLLSIEKIRFISLGIFLIIGAVILITTFFPSLVQLGI